MALLVCRRRIGRVECERGRVGLLAGLRMSATCSGPVDCLMLAVMVVVLALSVLPVSLLQATFGLMVRHRRGPGRRVKGQTCIQWVRTRGWLQICKLASHMIDALVWGLIVLVVNCGRCCRGRCRRMVVDCARGVGLSCGCHRTRHLVDCRTRTQTLLLVSCSGHDKSRAAAAPTTTLQA